MSDRPRKTTAVAVPRHVLSRHRVPCLVGHHASMADIDTAARRKPSDGPRKVRAGAPGAIIGVVTGRGRRLGVGVGAG